MPAHEFDRAEEQLPAARCAGVQKSYVAAGGAVHALTNVQAEFGRGEVTALVGPSGAGKSTLLRLLACVDRPDAGTIEIGGRDVTRLSVRARRSVRRRLIGYVLQDPAANLIEYLDADAHLTFAYQLAGRRAPGAGEEDLLDVLGLAHRRTHLPRTLSGGEQQRLAFAFAAATDPALLVADEPTAELDSVAGRKVIDGLRALAQRGTAVVVASHDDLVVDAADAVFTVAQGEVRRTR